MPLTIKPYQQQTSVQGAGAPRASVPMLVSNTGDALRAVGQSLQQTFAEQDAVRRMREEAEAERTRKEMATAWTADATSRMRLEWVTQATERQATVQPGAPGFTRALLKDFDEYAMALIGNAPEEARPMMKLSIANFRDNLGISGMQFETRARNDWTKDRLREGIDNAARAALADPAQQAAVLAEQRTFLNSAALPPEAKSLLMDYASQTIATAALRGRINMNREDMAGLDQLLAGVRENRFAGVPPNMLAASEAQILSLRTSLEGRLERERREREAERASDLEIKVKRGIASYQDIEGAYASGTITPAKRTELTVYLDAEAKAARKVALKEGEQLDLVRRTLEGRAFLDFRKDDDRKAVDLFYDRTIVPAIKASRLDPNQATEAVVEFTSKAGVMPSSVRRSIRGAFRAGSAEDKASAADLLDRLKAANPAVIEDFADQDIALGNAIGTYVRAGVSPQQAVAFAEKSLLVPEPEREARKVRYTQIKAPEKNQKRLEKELTGFRLLGPSLPGKVPDALVGEFERLTQEEFTRTGELEGAQSTALDHLRRVWGVTRTGGDPRWMKYAPETVYAVPGEDGSWIRKQLTSEATRGSVFEGKADLVLAADSLTARESRPSYVVLNRRNGVLEPWFGRDGKPMRFRPDFATSEAGKRRLKEIEADRSAGQATLDEARRSRGKRDPLVSIGQIDAP